MGHGSRLTIPAIRPDGLQLDEHRDRQRRYWRIQRIAWWGFAAVMALAVLGLTGSGGVFHSQTIRFADAVAEVPRVSRWQGSDSLTVTFNAAAPRHDLRISQPFFDRFSVEAVQPDPEETVVASGAQTLAFAARGPGPHRVAIDLRARHFGWTRFEMTIAGETRPVSLLVLP